MGVEVDDDPLAPTVFDTADVMRILAYDVGSTASIAATLAAARESARRARETLSTSMWEAINTTYRAIPSGHFRSMRPAGRLPVGPRPCGRRSTASPRPR